MKNKNVQNGIIGILVISGIAYLFRDEIFLNRKKAEEIISKKLGKSSVNPSYDDKYVIAWAKAIKRDKLTFKVNNKEYSAITGRSI